MQETLEVKKNIKMLKLPSLYDDLSLASVFVATRRSLAYSVSSCWDLKVCERGGVGWAEQVRIPFGSVFSWKKLQSLGTKGAVSDF